MNDTTKCSFRLSNVCFTENEVILCCRRKYAYPRLFLDLLYSDCFCFNHSCAKLRALFKRLLVYTSKLTTSLACSMINVRRGCTSSPMSKEKILSASTAS